jgi:lipoprotein-anchoring transpeptidase ErfK/SrfK
MVLFPDNRLGELPLDEHIVFDGVLYIPPYGTRNRTVTKELGEFALDLGGGYLIHGTPDEESIGQQSTHGCIRMYAVDLAWLYEHVPVGTPVSIR